MSIPSRIVFAVFIAILSLVLFAASFRGHWIQITTHDHVPFPPYRMAELWKKKLFLKDYQNRSVNHGNDASYQNQISNKKPASHLRIFESNGQPYQHIINPHLCHHVSIQPNVTVGGGNGSCVELGLSPSPLPLTALASFPGSGNTWVRHLIQQITGIYTGAVYKDPFLRAKGFPGEGKRNGEVIVIKTHHPKYSGVDNLAYEKAVVLVRNPYGALLAFYSFTLGNHTSIPSRIDGQDWARFMDMELKEWQSSNSYWLNKDLCIYILIYDRLKQNLRRELVSLAEFLGVHHPSEEHLDCVISNAEGNFHRKSHLGDLYTDSMKANVDRHINEFEELLRSKIESY